mgnify:CR=1 FL=1
MHGTERGQAPGQVSRPKALEIDPSLAAAHAPWETPICWWTGIGQPRKTEYDRALELNPNLPEAHLGYEIYFATHGTARRSDRPTPGKPFASTRSPSRPARGLFGWTTSQGTCRETVDEAKRTLELEPQAALPYALLAVAYADLGRKDEAVQAAQNALRLGADGGSVIATAASALARAGQPARARQVLNQALELEKQHYVCRFLVGGVF